MLADGKHCIRIREKTPEFSIASPTTSPYYSQSNLDSKEKHNAEIMLLGTAEKIDSSEALNRKSTNAQNRLYYHQNENGWFCEHGDVWGWVPAARWAPEASRRESVVGRCADHLVTCGTLDTMCLAQATNAGRN